MQMERMVVSGTWPTITPYDGEEDDVDDVNAKCFYTSIHVPIHSDSWCVLRDKVKNIYGAKISTVVICDEQTCVYD